MSGRRVRIKGVANIPVRRKNEVTTDKKVKEPEEKQDNVQNDKKDSLTETQQTDSSVDEKKVTKNDNITKITDETIKNPEIPSANQISNNNDQETLENTKENIENQLDTSENKIVNNSENNTVPGNRFTRWTSRPSVKIPSLQRKAKPPNKENTNTTTPEITKITDKNENIESEKPETVSNKPKNTEPVTENIVKSVSFDSSTNFDNVNNPISPNKSLNRTRIKPVPRFNIRRNSFHGSASESEDDSRKTHNRTRNDSVCSIGNSETPGKDDLINKEKQTKVLVQRKIRYTDQSRKLATAKREFQLKFGSENPDRKRLTMMDLIFYNPTTNPMSEKPARKNSVEIVDPIRIEEEKEDDPLNISDTEDAPVPQVKVGPDGEIILDEQSLVIEQTGTKRAREQIENSQIIIDDLDTGYGVYKKAKRSKDWTFAETLRFYRTLNTVGTDFSLMLGLFPGRSRKELKMKFKKEEKNNRMLVDKVLMNPLNFNLEELEEQLQNDKEEEDIFNKKIVVDKSSFKKKRKTKSSVLSRQIDDENEVEIKRKRVSNKKGPKNNSYIALQKGIDSIIDTSESENESILLENENLNDSIEVNVTSDARPTRVCRLKNPSNFEKCFESDNSDNDIDIEAENQQKLISKQLQKVGTVVDNIIKLKNKNILEDEVIEFEEEEGSIIENDPNPEEEMVDTNIVIAHSENEEPDKIYLDILSKNATEKGIETAETKVSLQIKKSQSDITEEVTPKVDVKIENGNKTPVRSTDPTNNDKPSVEEKSSSKNMSLQSLGSVEPGSLMIMTNINEKGEKVYKVYMVTPDNEKIPIDLSDDIIQSLTALEEQEKEEDQEEEISVDS